MENYEVNKETIVITAGSAYIDIDVLACAIALNHLYSLLDLKSFVCLTGMQNGTIPFNLKESTKTLIEPKLIDSNNYIYAIVDVSNPEFFESFVEENKVVEIFDHHFGFEQYWEKRCKGKAHIHHVGSCATLIWEKYVEHNATESVPQLVAELLYLAIISNTLNLKAFVTHERDRLAKQQIEKTGLIPDTIVSDYYSDIESQMLSNFEFTLINDVKRHYWEEQLCFIAQVELLDSEKLIENYFINDSVEKYLKSHFGISDELWFVIVSDINKGINFIYTKNNVTKRLIEKTFSFIFEGDFAKSDRLWMRKELIRNMA